MKIENHISKAINQVFIVCFAALLMFGIVTAILLSAASSSGITASSLLRMLFSISSEVDISIKALFILIIFIAFSSLLLLLYYLKIRISDERDAINSGVQVKYIEFSKNYLKIKYYGFDEINEIYYKDIDLLELVIAANRDGIEALNIYIESGSYNCTMHHVGFSLKKLYKIVYYGQYAKSFLFRFTGNNVTLQNELYEFVNRYIKNNCEETLIDKMRSPIGIIVVSLAITAVTILIAILNF